MHIDFTEEDIRIYLPEKVMLSRLQVEVLKRHRYSLSTVFFCDIFHVFMFTLANIALTDQLDSYIGQQQ